MFTLLLRTLERLDPGRSLKYLVGFHGMGDQGNKYVNKSKAHDDNRREYYSDVLFRLLHNCLHYFEQDREHKSYSMQRCKRVDTIWQLLFKDHARLKKLAE